MDAPQLSAGCLQAALTSDFAGCPVWLQVLDVQRVQPKGDSGGQSRIKLVVSDGVHKCMALLASQLKDLADSGQLQVGTIVEVKELVGNKALQATTSVGAKKLLIILNLEVRGTYPTIIGSPQNVPDSALDGGAAGAAPAAPPAGGYGAPPPQQQHGARPPGGGYGAPPPGANGGGYGGPPPGAGYGAPPPAHAAPLLAAGGYGAPPPAAGGGYGAPPPRAGAGGPGGGYGMGGGGGMGMGGGGGPGAIARAEDQRVVPIKSLNPYQGRWTIKARCTNKGDVRTYNNARGGGRMFSFDLLDKEGGEIRVTAWNDQVDMFANMIQPGGVYLLSKGSLKPKNARFNSTRHDFEIFLERNSVLQPVADGDGDAAAIPLIVYNFTKLAEVERIAAGTVIDVIGIVHQVNAPARITRRDGTDTDKRSVHLKDDSGATIELTLWDKHVAHPGQDLEDAVGSQGRFPVLAVKGVRVGDFNGKNLSTINSSTLTLDPPDLQEAHMLRKWHDVDGGAQAATVALGGGGGASGGRGDRRVCLKLVDDEQLGMRGTGPEYVVVPATVSYINSDKGLTYAACSRDFNGRPCQKKLSQQQDGTFYCERCCGPSDPTYRYLLSVKVDDHTQSRWLTAFGDAGDALIGVGAAQAHAAQEAHAAQQDESYLGLINDRIFRSYSFKLKVAEDNYNGETRCKVSIQRVGPLDFLSESRTLIDQIQKLSAGQPIYQPLGQAGGGGAAAGAGFPRAGGGAPAAAAGGWGNQGGGGGGGYGGAPAQQQGGPPPQQQGNGNGGGGGGGWQQNGGGGGWQGGGGGGGGGWQQNGGGGGGGGGGWQQNGGGGGGGWQQNGGGGGGGWQQQQQQQQQGQQAFNAGWL